MALVCQKPRLSRPFCQDSNAANLKWLASPRVVPELGEATPPTLALALRGCQPRAAYPRGRAAWTSAPEPGAFRLKRYRITQDRTTVRREITVRSRSGACSSAHVSDRGRTAHSECQGAPTCGDIRKSKQQCDTCIPMMRTCWRLREQCNRPAQREASLRFSLHLAKERRGKPVTYRIETCESGGIGRRTRLRIWRGNPWGFESPLSHQSLARQLRFVPTF